MKKADYDKATLQLQIFRKEVILFRLEGWLIPKAIQHNVETPVLEYLIDQTRGALKSACVNIDAKLWLSVLSELKIKDQPFNFKL